MPGRRDTWTKPLPRQNIVIIRRADRTPLTRRQRAELAELNAEVNTPPDDRNLWETEYKLARKIGQDSTSTKVQGGRRKTRRVRGGTGKKDPEFKTRHAMTKWERGMNAEQDREFKMSPTDAQNIRVDTRIDEKKEVQKNQQSLPGGTRRSKRKSRKNRR